MARRRLAPKVLVLTALLGAAAAVAGSGGAGAGSPAPAAVPARPAASAARPRVASGFRLETGPFIDDVFGDASDYRRSIDRFIGLYEAEQPVREKFSSSVAQALAAVEDARQRQQASRRGACPDDEIALPYTRAFHLGGAYLKAGKEMAVEYATLENLDALGETSGLTPDYRYKVQRAHALWEQLLTDYREMHVAFHDELVPEIEWLGCDPEALLALGEQRGGDELAGYDGPDPSMPLPPEIQPPPSPPAASLARQGAPASQAAAHAAPLAPLPAEDPRSVQTVPFTIDDSACKEPVAVVLDGMPQGGVEGGHRAVFRAAVGPHDLCVLPMNGSQQCGERGTVRTDYIHDGWTLAFKCAAPSAGPVARHK